MGSSPRCEMCYQCLSTAGSEGGCSDASLSRPFLPQHVGSCTPMPAPVLVYTRSRVPPRGLYKTRAHGVCPTSPVAGREPVCACTGYRCTKAWDHGSLVRIQASTTLPSCSQPLIVLEEEERVVPAHVGVSTGGYKTAQGVRLIRDPSTGRANGDF